MITQVTQRHVIPCSQGLEVERRFAVSAAETQTNTCNHTERLLCPCKKGIREREREREEEEPLDVRKRGRCCCRCVVGRPSCSRVPCVSDARTERQVCRCVLARAHVSSRISFPSCLHVPRSSPQSAQCVCSLSLSPSSVCEGRRGGERERARAGEKEV